MVNFIQFRGLPNDIKTSDADSYYSLLIHPRTADELRLSTEKSLKHLINLSDRALHFLTQIAFLSSREKMHYSVEGKVDFGLRKKRYACACLCHRL